MLTRLQFGHKNKGDTMAHIWTLRRGAVAIAAALVFALASSSSGADILDDWDAVKPPPRPELKPVTLEGSTTALLILDMMKSVCGHRPRCVASIPNVKRLHDAARAAGAMVWYSFVGAPGKTTPADVVDLGSLPRDGEWALTGGPDKFLGTNLEQELKARDIKTVIVCGTSFQGVGIAAASDAAQRGYNVIVPVDCLSSEDAYREQYAAWHLYKGGPIVVTRKVTLTRSTMIKFQSHLSAASSQ
jgi:nicotinamidase-related amidase